MHMYSKMRINSCVMTLIKRASHRLSDRCQNMLFGEITFIMRLYINKSRLPRIDLNLLY